MLAGKQVSWRLAFWLTLILLLLLLACAPFLPTHRGGEALDWSRTWFCLGVASTFLDYLNVVAWAYCVLTALALFHFYEKARGKTGIHSLVAYCVPNTVMLLLVVKAVTCVFAAEHAAHAAVVAGDLANVTFYYESGQQGIYGGGASPLFFAGLILLVNGPLCLVLATRSWRALPREDGQLTQRVQADAASDGDSRDDG